MLGEYGDKENARRLEEFQNSNTEATEFMLVMNKANEGLHLDKLNGIIWLRPLDENSRILYLQQLGRAIYSENPDRPTKDEDRPVVIDLVNNTIKVNWDNEITEQSDIQMLNLIVDWAESHDGVLPDINSTDKEENGYAKVLKEIQSKYKEYLEQEFDEEELEQKQIEEIEEIIRLGSEVDLWQIELPDRIAKSGETQERSLTDKNSGPFELTGLLKDFVKLEDEVDESEYKTVVERFIETLKQLQTIGVDVSKLVAIDTIETLAEKSGINREKLEEIGLDLTLRIGNQKTTIVQAYRGHVACKPPTKKQVEELAKLGISLEKRDTVQEFIDALEILQIIGVDVSKMTQKDTIETLAKKSGINREKLEERGLDLTLKIGMQKTNIAQAFRGKGNCRPPTKKQVEELAKLGISLERRNMSQELIDALKTLQTIGVNVSKMSSSDTIETLAKKSGISREKVEEIGLDPAEKIGIQKSNIAQAYRGKREGKRPTKEQVEELAKLGISLERKEISGRDIVEATISSLTDQENADRVYTELQKLVEQREQKIGVDIGEQP